MHKLRWFLLGVCCVCGIALLAGAVFISIAHGFSAREQPTSVERWTARLARAAALPADAKTRKNPILSSPDVLAEARAHWADHCAACHANDGSGDTLIGKRTYPPSPDMRMVETQQRTDGELFYIIQNGIRLTAMPGWASGTDHDEQDSWKLVHFIRHLPKLTIEEKKDMERLNPKSPEDIKEEQEEEKFLNGEDHNEPQIEHHHH
jgi:mono/diheme cytochrome c family protein